MILEIVIGVFVLFAIVIYSFHRKGKTKADSNIMNANSTLDLLYVLLKRLNCQPQTEKKDNSIFVSFEFQGGHFRIRLQPSTPYIQLSLLFFFEASLDKLSLVRHICNELDIQYTVSKCVYSIDEENGIIHIHAFSGFILTKEILNITDYFESLLSNCFDLKHTFIDWYGKIESKETNDLELDDAEQNRKLYLLREQEFAHQPENRQWRIHDTKKLTLDELLRLSLDSVDIQLIELKVVTYEFSILSDPLLISSFDLLSPMINSAGEKTTLRCEHSTLVLYFLIPSQKPQTMIINIEFAGMAENTYYFRITYTLPPLSIDKVISLNSERNKPQSCSFIVAYDNSSDAAKKAEFNYIWEDAKDKILNNRQNELTEEQRLICDCTLSNTAYHLYWGEKTFLAERYYEALLHFENAYYASQAKFHTLNNSERETFYEICYLIGFCYCELQQHQRAYFFLDITFNQNKITHTKEYVNCLVNSKDFRAIHIIDNLLNNLQQHYGNSEEELPPQILSFIYFLRRRKAYAFIDLGQLDEAIEIFTAMLNEPENSDYALHELAYIQKLKEGK